MSTNTTYLQEQIQRSLIAIRKLKEENSKLKATGGKDPIAVIGVSCKLPGGVDSVSKFWNAITEGKDLISEIPNDRWDTDQFYDAGKNSEGTYYTKFSGVLKRNLKAFDPTFFNISPLEAKYMDPQQRLLLEAAWETFENANIPSDTLLKSETGVFIGIASFDNAIRLHQSHAPISAYTGTGNTLSGGAGRIAHVFGLCGPVMSIDTACSSSLVALHQACKSIHNNECTSALVGGVNILLSPDVMINFCQSNMLAEDGKCKTFDESANGYVRGEGVGMVMLKSYSEALKDGDNILGLIKGSAVNHDGRSAGLTVPSGHAQQTVIEKALKDANLSPNQIGYVECHGTGTSLGDPIEFEAIAKTYGKRDSDNVLHIGSLKTNIGHLEAAAGVAGLIKLILCLKNKSFVPHLHVSEPSKHIPWSKFPQIKLTEKNEEWKLNSDQETRRAGISSFGFTGTNAHVIVEEYVAKENDFSPSKNSQALLTLSAKSKNALDDLRNRYIDLLEDTKESIVDIAYSSTVGRNHFAHRIAVNSKSKETLLDELKNWKGTSTSHLESPKVAFLFTGQGSQYLEMGADLYKTNSFFRKKIEECDAILKDELDVSLLDLLFNADNESQLHQTQYAQPAIFAIEYALASLWKHWGVEPVALIGHSIGELVAACFAGVFTLEDGLKLVAARGRLMQNAPKDGVMYSTNMAGEELLPYTEKYKFVSVAAYNSSKQSVVSGLKEEVELIVDQLKSDGFLTHELQVSHAFHSPLMEPARIEFHELLKKVKFAQANKSIISNSTGKLVREELTTPEYWSDQLINPVNFIACIKSLSEMNLDAYVEVGPTPILLSLIASTVSDSPELIPSLRKHGGATENMQNAISSLYQLGANFNWKKIHNNEDQNKVMLPNYPFQLQEYWIEGDTIVRTNIDKSFDAPKVYQTKWKQKQLESPELEQLVNEDWLFIEFENGAGDNFKQQLSLKVKGTITQLDLSKSDSDSSEVIQEALIGMTSDFRCVVFPKGEIGEPNTYTVDGLNLLELIKQLSGLNKLSTLQSLTILSTVESNTSSFSANGMMTLSQVFENEFGLSTVQRIWVEDRINQSHSKAILQEITSGEKESEVLFTADHRSVKRLETVKALTPNEVPLFKKDKSYLVTGGTGALGTKLVDWLVKKDAKHLVLLSRSGNLDTTTKALYKEYVRNGVSIEIVKVDLSVKYEIETVMSKFGNELPELDGVFHLSGVISDGLMVNQSEAQFRKALAPKVDGSWNLHESTKKKQLQFFVQFSSVSSILGTPGQANYAYANSFMDRLTELRTANDLPCLTLNWGPWAGSGMANNVDDKSIQLIETIEAEQAFATLGNLLSDKSQGNFVVGSIDEQIAEELNISLMKSLDKKTSGNEESSIATEPSSSANGYSIDDLHKIIADVIELPLSQMETNVPIINYGFDSLLALKTQNKIRKDFGVDLNASEFMKNPSIEDLHAIIMKVHEHTEPEIETENKEDVSGISLDNIDQLSEEEIDQLLKSLN